MILSCYWSKFQSHQFSTPAARNSIGAELNLRHLFATVWPQKDKPRDPVWSCWCETMSSFFRSLGSKKKSKSSLALSEGSSPVRYAKFESIRYFIDIDILQNCLIDIDIDIDIFQNHHIDIDIDIFGIALSISISIFSKMTISILILISIFFKSVDISTIDMSYRYIEQGYRTRVR